MKKSDGHIAHSSKDLRSIAGAKTRTVFLKGDIPDVMRAGFNSRVSAHEGEEVKRRGLLRAQIRDEIDDLGGGHAFLGDGARYLGHLGDEGPVGSEIGVQFMTSANDAMFHPSEAPIPRLSTLANRMRISKREREIGIQRRLVALDGEDALAALVMGDLHEVGMRLQGIGCHDPS